MSSSPERPAAFAALFSLYRGVSSAVFYTPIIVLFFERSYGPGVEVYVLITVYTLSTALLELPTGLIADVKGNHHSLRWSLVASLLAALCLGASLHTFFVLALLGQLLEGLGRSLRSGTESAYLRNAVGAAAYKRLEAGSGAYRYLSLALASVVGGWLYSADPRLPFWITAAALFVGLLILKRLPDEFGARPVERQPGQVFASIARVFSSGPAFTLLFGTVALSFATLGLLYWTYALYLDSVGYAASSIGLSFAALEPATGVPTPGGVRVSGENALRECFALGTSVLIGF